MNKDLVDSLISQNNFSKKKNLNACSICKCDKLPIDLSKKNKIEIKLLLNKFKFKETDLSVMVKKCNCTKNSPKAHKLCILLNILYNFNLKCNECNANYNIVVKQRKNTARKVCNLCSLIIYLFINLVIYAGSVFLILYNLIINKNESNDPERNKLEHVYYFFGGLIFILNTFFIYVTISSIVFNNPEDINDYTIDINDISEPNKNKDSDKFYNLLYKFYRYFYKSQIRFLIGKKHKHIYISKGYGYFNKDLQNLIIKNNIECERENKLNNGGENILNINKKNNSKNGLNDLQEKIKYSAEKSNGNIENNNLENVKRSSTIIEKENKNNENLKKESKNNTANLPQLKDNIVFTKNSNNNNNNKEELPEKKNELISNKDKNGSEVQVKEKEDKKEEKKVEENEEKKVEEKKEEKIKEKEEEIKEKEIEKKNEKNLVIEIINTDKMTNNKEKNNKKEEIENKIENDNINKNNISLHSEKEKKSLISISSKKGNLNSKNDLIKINIEKEIEEKNKNENKKNQKKDNNDKIYIESTEPLNNNENGDKLKFDDDANSKKILNEPNIIFNDNFNLFISTPFHNNGK